MIQKAVYALYNSMYFVMFASEKEMKSFCEEEQTNVR